MNASTEIFENIIFLSDTWNNTPVDHEGSNLSFVFDLNDEAEVQKVKDFFDHAEKLGCEETMTL